METIAAVPLLPLMESVARCFRLAFRNRCGPGPPRLFDVLRDWPVPICECLREVDCGRDCATGSHRHLAGPVKRPCSLRQPCSPVRPPHQLRAGMLVAVEFHRQVAAAHQVFLLGSKRPGTACETRFPSCTKHMHIDSGPCSLSM